MRIGIVCPYSFDVPGGVQFHIRDLAECFIAKGHDVSVLAPAEDDTPLPEYVERSGRAVAVRYNGSVARLNFGLVASSRVRKWLANGHFDVLHLHEPISPSIGMLAMWQAKGPIVATFHSSQTRSRALQVAYPLIRSSLEKISARIAVSEDARRTVVDHLGGDAVVVPNGVYVDKFANASVNPLWTSTPDAPTFAFLGRLEEPRKGLQIFLDAANTVLREHPGARFLVAGHGDIDMGKAMAGAAADRVKFLGPISEEEKAQLLSSVHAYIAPQTGGESFGIVLVEAMSAGTLVIASDLGAFRRVLGEGELGFLFSVGDAADLADAMMRSITDPQTRQQRIDAADIGVERFDWSAVSRQIMTVYEMAIASSSVATVSVDSDAVTPGDEA